MPFPPPPADALKIIGNPIFFAVFKASSSFSTRFPLPGTTGMPFLFIICLAFDLSPPIRIFSEEGPIKVILDAVHASTKCGFSARKPYPG